MPASKPGPGLSTSSRKDADTMHCTDPAAGTIYLIHFDTPYKHARHYTGWTTDLDARLQAHREGRGSRLMEVITKAGITWRLVRTWLGGRDRERAIKNRHEAPRLCPECSVPPRPLTTGRAAAPPVSTITHHAVAVVASPPRISPYERGIRNGEQFITERAGWTAERILASYHYVTSPFRDKTRHSQADQDWFRGYTEPITRYLAAIQAAQAGCALRSDGGRADQPAGGIR
jgi:predicted GIY-YIG superfamily endonuclease